MFTEMARVFERALIWSKASVVRARRQMSVAAQCSKTWQEQFATTLCAGASASWSVVYVLDANECCVWSRVSAKQALDEIVCAGERR